MKGKSGKRAVRKDKPQELDDSRFSHLKSDPKFGGLSNINRKVVIEKRFAAALTDEKFSARAPVDKRGKKLKKTTGNELLDLYEVEDDGVSDVEEPVIKRKKKGGQDKPSADDGSESNDSDSEKPFRMDLARGEGNLSSSDDDSDDESDWELPGDVQPDIELEQLDNDVERVEWASRRLAVCNLDWDLIKADDILILVRSFKPDGGRVNSVTIFLSDFGKERLDDEEKHGPRLQLSKPLDEYEDEELDPETKLAYRKFQLDRLKYYYAVIDCDSQETASAIYEQCDGFQFETTGLKMDLRFIPDDMNFDEDRLKERFREDDLIIQKYKSKEKIKAGITQTKSTLDWDQDDTLRQQKMQDAFDKDDYDGHELIAGSDSEDDETTAKRRDALLSLLNSDSAKEGVSVDWDNKADENDNSDDEDSEPNSNHEEGDSDDSDIEKALSRRGTKASTTVSADKNNKKEAVQSKKTTYKSYLEKKKLKRTERKQEALEARELEKEALQAVGEEAKMRVKEKLKKRKAAAASSDLSETVATDDRFKALFTDSAFTIEQSSKEYKGSKLVQKQADVKRDIRENQVEDAKGTGSDLLSKLKNKTEKFNAKKQKLKRNK